MADKIKYKSINIPEGRHTAFEATRRKAIMTRDKMFTLADIAEEGRRLLERQLDRELDKKIAKAEQ